jgi:hypothetical protein
MQACSIPLSLSKLFVFILRARARSCVEELVLADYSTITWFDQGRNQMNFLCPASVNSMLTIISVDTTAYQ